MVSALLWQSTQLDAEANTGIVFSAASRAMADQKFFFIGGTSFIWMEREACGMPGCRRQHPWKAFLATV